MKNSFGEFLKQKRTEQNLTQKQLAKMLIVSESAVSKWEKDVAHPDITLLPKLAQILKVTEHELITASIDHETREEKSQAKKWRTLSFSWSLFFYISYVVALVPCFICDLAINKGLTWFWIVAASLLLSFTFTNLPKLIKKYKLVLIPLSMFLALCLLLGVCCIFTNGNWFWVATLSVLLGLIIIFTPIYISKLKVFSKIKKFNDFISVFVDFVALNVLLVVTDTFCVTNGYSNHWFLNIALPIVLCLYLMLNLLLSVRFLKINKLLKTSIILFLINLFIFVPPMFIKISNPYVQQEIDDFNICNANFKIWNTNTIENNVVLIVELILLGLSLIFFVTGLLKHLLNKKKK